MEEDLHVFERVDGDSHASHLSSCQAVVGVVADLSGEVEGGPIARFALALGDSGSGDSTLRPSRSRHTDAWSNAGCDILRDGYRE